MKKLTVLVVLCLVACVPIQSFSTMTFREDKGLSPVLYVMLDCFNGDWGNPDYRFSYVDKHGYRRR